MLMSYNNSQSCQNSYHHLSNKKTCHYLACSANLPEGLHILLALITFFLSLMITQGTTISGSTEPIFAISSLYESVLGADDQCMYLYWAKITLHTFICHAAIEKCHGVLECFTQINCIQQVSISTRISLSMFAKWQHGYFSLLLARGRHCDAKLALWQNSVTA